MIIQGDCIEIMADMPENSVDAIVTDPPYGLEFMGKEWDRLWVEHPRGKQGRIDGKGGMDTWGNTPQYESGLKAQLWHTQWATQALRVLKPGGYLLAFGGTRTYHRLVCGLEDAGFEIRDTVLWLYGSGFPKNLDISKQIDKMAGAKREVVGIKTEPNGRNRLNEPRGICERNTWGQNNSGFKESVEKRIITAPATEAAKEWQGWGTALKPAHEPICVARKPLSEKNVASNVLKWGTGGIDIDGSRIGTDILQNPQKDTSAWHGNKWSVNPQKNSGEISQVQGRWPANVILDEEAAAMLDEQSGELSSGAMDSIAKPNQYNVYGKMYQRRVINPPSSGGASRFYYCAKASPSERGKGNTHPTCKPIKLMEYLIKLVSREGATILDPFAGSGSTILAAVALGRKCIAIEQSEEYCEMARGRCRQMALA